MKAFDEKYGVNILEGYGLSETSPVASFNVLDRPKKAGSIGAPIWGVEFKLVDAEDNTGARFDAMYDGWGWQAWGGVTIRFGQQLRMVAEVFRTEANLGRTVEDPDTGARYHELADGDDVGARFGLRFGS